MKTRYKYIHFNYSGLLEEWECHSNDGKEILGEICQEGDEYHFIAYFSYRLPEFTEQNLRDIADFLEQLNKEKKT